MMIRSISIEDIPTIQELNEQQSFKLPHINNCIVDRIVEKDGKVIAYGIVKHMGEAIFLASPNAPTTSRVKAMCELMKVAIFGAKRANCQQLHVFVKDEKLAQLLEKKFNFVRSTDIVLAKEL